MALVICLSLIVLLTVAVLAFFVRATANQAVESSRADRIKAEQIAQSASDYVVGQFLQEIETNSTITTVNNVSIYHPNTNSVAVPARGIAAAVSPTDANYDNLLRQSVPSIDSNASGISSATASKNGRIIGADRWNATALLGGLGFTSANQLPNWISIEKNGTPSNGTSTNVVGRFAYNVYNLGGLLNANVAGYPSMASSGTNRALLKDTLAGADLTRLGVDQTAVDQLIAFRNPGTTSAIKYVEDVKEAAQDGFNRKSSGVAGGYANNLFASRQDLIRYVRTENPGLTNALPYLSTFSSAVNGPSFTPGGLTPANPSLIDLRVKTTFTRLDGTQAKVGEPLLKSRFPLDRLSLLTRTATAGTSDLIYKYFGLTRTSAASPWVYDHGNPAQILTLAEVANLTPSREPDFFELLQAGIDSGSLGKSLSDGHSQVHLYDSNKQYQLIQIGLNLIDQYDEDSFPTRISFDAPNYPYDFYGIENLPYLARVFQTMFRVPGTDEFRFWLQPEIWNPHAQANEVSTLGPTEFRFRPTGTIRIVFSVFGPAPGVYVGLGDLNLSPGIGFERRAADQTFAEPTVLDPSLPVPPESARAEDNFNGGGHKFMGIYICTINVPAAQYDGAIPTQYDVSPNFGTEINQILEYKDNVTGTYLPYDRISRITTGQGIYVGGLQDNPTPRFFLIRPDPRTNRFGIGMDINEPAVNTTLRPAAGAGAPVGGFMGLKADNHPGVASSYADPDNVRRPADGAYNSGRFPSAYPLAAGNLPSRPLVLNRPFRSVGEMGYASRGMPWKHLDFFTATSGDSALLDLFCISQGPETAIVGGSIDLNTRSTKVLEAVLAGTMKSETDGTVLDAEVSNLAASLRTLTTGEPLLNPNELVSRWMGNPANSVAANSADTVIKRRREAGVRALADVGETRTWNLLIDVIGQNGRYLPDGTFIVEGERRLWTSVAIDRYTGKIISRAREVVAE